MVESIGSSPSNMPLQPTESSINVPHLSKQMQEQALFLADQLKQILDNPALTAQTAFLRDFTQNGQQLHKTVEQAIQLR